MSCVASCGSFANTNSTMMFAKLSSEFDVHLVDAADAGDRFLDRIDHLALDDVGRRAGIGNRHRRRPAASISGNSSVLSCSQRDDAEHHERQHRDDGDDRALDGDIGDEHGNAYFIWTAHGHRRAGVMPCDAPRSSMSPSFRPDRTMHALGARIAQAERHVDALGLAVRNAQHPRRRVPSC